jgi:PBP1b-binding outer membrane lipoprotein LpoB
MKKLCALIIIGIFLVGCDQNQMAGDQEINKDAPAAAEQESLGAADDMGSMEAPADQEQIVMEEPTMGREQETLAEPGLEK